MIPRARGDHAGQNVRPWTPTPTGSQTTRLADEPHETAVDTEPGVGELPAVTVAEPEVRRRRTGFGIVVLIGAVAAIAASHHNHAAPARASVPLPATPSAWVQQWTAAALDNPGQVCDRLYAPALAQAFKADTGRSCTAYYTNVHTVSFRLRHILLDGPTAAIEAQQLSGQPNSGFFTMLLSHVDGGWQAVDIVPGGSVRPR